VHRDRDFDNSVYKDWRKKVFNRDRYKCQMPGCGSKGKINAHHIRRWADAANLRFDTRNGITLCWNCHRKVTGDELRYEGLFIQIAYENEAK